MDKVLIGKILKPKGLDGTLKITNFTLGELALNFKSVFIGSESYHVLRAYTAGEFVYIKTQEISSIEQADGLRNKEIYGLRENLNLADDEFLNNDLIGLDVFVDNKKIGVLEDIENFGASDIFVINQNGREVQAPNVNGLIEKIDLKESSIWLNKKIFDEVKVWK